MTVSKLIFLRNAIQALTFSAANDNIEDQQTLMSSIADTFPASDHSAAYGKFKTDMQVEINTLIKCLNNINNITTEYVDLINETIRVATPDIIRGENESWLDGEFGFKTADYIRINRNLTVTAATADRMKAHIGRHIDWKYPGLEIGPHDGMWTRELVAADPLYIVDYDHEFLDSTKALFSQQYQNRLRCYNNLGRGLHMLPQNQIGFVFSWNTFNYMSLSQIRIYLDDIFKVMRPGGSAMISYNNAEQPFSAQRSEEGLMTFIPKRILHKAAQDFGFENIKTVNADTAISWIEFKKPGV